jgi:hypothetical protein
MVGYDSLGLVFFALFIASSSIVSITAITNAMSGHESIMTEMTPYYITFPFIIILFCISFSYVIRGFSDNAEYRKKLLFFFVALVYILSMIALHLSSVIINLSYR